MSKKVAVSSTGSKSAIAYNKTKKRLTKTNVSDRERNLLEALSKAQSIASLGSWEMSGNFQETHWSDEFYRIHGLEPQSVKPSTKMRLAMVHPMDRQKLQSAIKDAIKNGKPYSIEKRIIRPSKEIRWVLSQGEVSIDAVTGKRKVFGTILDITEKKLQTIKNAEIEESLRRVQAIARIGSFTVIGNDDEVYWSDEFYHIHGLEPGSVKPSTELRLSMVHPQDRKKIKNAIVNTIKTGKPYLIEKRIVQPSGEIRWVQSQGASSIDSITGKQKLVGTLLDITERKVADDRFNSLLNDTSVGILLQGSRSEIILNNQASLDLLGISEDQLLGKTSFDPMWNVIHEDGSDFPGVTHPVPQAIKTKSPVRNIVMGVYHPAQQDRTWLLVDAIPRLDKQGDVVDVICTFNNITSLKSTQNIANENQLRLQVITDNLPNVAIYQYEVAQGEWQGGYTYCSPGFEKLTGISPHQMMENPLLFEERIHPDDWKLKQQKIGEANVGLTNFDQTYRFQHLNGSWRWLQTKSQPASINGKTSWNGLVIDITDKVLAEVELNLRNVTIRQMSDSAFWIKSDASIVYFNTAAHESLGYTYDEMKGLKVPDLDPNYSAEVWPLHWQELKQNKILRFESEQRRKDGSLRVVEITANYIVYNGEEFNCALVRDITERKRSENLLIESESKYRLLADNMQDMVCLHSPEGFFEYVSPSSKKIVGYEAVELIGKNIYHYCHPDDVERIMEDAHQGVITENRVIQITFRVRHKAGNYIWVEAHHIPIYDEKRQLIAIQTSFRDVTLRKEYEEKLAESNTRLQALFYNAINGIILADDQGNFIDGNPAICEMLGYSYKEFVRLNASKLKLSSQPKTTMFGEFLSEGRSHGNVNLRAKWGRTVVVRYNAVANILPGIHLAIIEDVTETQKVERRLVKSQSTVRAFFQSTNDAIILINRNFRIIDFNKLADEYALLVLGKNLTHNGSMLEFSTKANENAFKENLVKAFHGDTTSKEIEIYYPFGHQIWWRIQYIPIKDTANEIDAIAFVGANIDKEKRANQRLVNLTDNIPNGMIYEYRIKRNGKDHKFTYMSQGAEQLFEIDPQKLVDDVDLAFSLVVEEDIPFVMHKIKVATQDSINFDVEYRVKVPSGKIKWIRVLAKPRQLADDSKVLEGIVIDITHQKNLEAEQIKSKLDLQNMLDNMIYGVVQVNAQGKITYANHWACDILDIKRNEIEGDYYYSTHWKQIDVEGYWMSSDQLPLGIALAQNRRVEKMVHGIVNNQGTLKWLMVNANPLIDSAGNVTAAVASFEDITETRALEYNFRKNAEQMRFAAKFAKIGEWELDLLTMMPTWSEEVCRIHEVENGFAPHLNEAINFYTDEFKPVISKAVERCIATGEYYDLILQIITKAGNRKWIRTVGLRDMKNNKPTKLYGLFQDIDETKLKEIELERLALIAKETDNMVVLTDANCVITWVNDSFTKVTGYAAAEAVGRRPSELLQGPETNQSTMAYIREKLNLRESADCEIINYRKTGEKYWVHIAIQPLFDEKGKVTSFLAIQADITARKKQDEMLAEEHLLLHTIIDNLPINIYVKNTSHQRTLVNRFEYEYLGASSEQEIIGKNDQKLYPNNMAEISFEEDRQIFAGNSILNKETLNARNDGSQTWFLTSKVPLKNTEGKIIGLVGVSVDITERKKQEADLLASNREKDFLIKEIHHRVKNNLQLISSIIYLKSMTLQPSHIKLFLDETRQKIRSMAIIHEHLLQSEKLSQVNCYDYMQKLIAEIQMALVTEEFDLKIETDIQNVMVNLDTAMYCGLIVNELMTNAFKYAFQGMRTGCIKVAMTKESDCYQILVSDNGIGITTEPGRSDSFGMEMLNAFVNQLNGKMVVKKEMGTVFTIRF